MACCVFIQQRLHEQQPCLCQRRIALHKCHFAQITAAFVRVQQGLERIVPLFGIEIHHLAVAEGETEAIHHRAIQHQRAACLDCAVDAEFVRAGGYLRRRDVRKIHVRRVITAHGADPQHARLKADGDIRADAIGVVDAVDVLAIEDVGELPVFAHSVQPIADGGVFVNAADTE